MIRKMIDESMRQRGNEGTAGSCGTTGSVDHWTNEPMDRWNNGTVEHWNSEERFVLGFVVITFYCEVVTFGRAESSGLCCSLMRERVNEELRNCGIEI